MKLERTLDTSLLEGLNALLGLGADLVTETNESNEVELRRDGVILGVDRLENERGP